MAGIDLGRAPGARVTWREFTHAPDDGQRYELIDSRLYRTPPLTSAQQAVVGNLTAAFVAFRRSERKGDLVGAPFTLFFCQHDYVEPAFIWCERKRLRQIYNRGNVRGAPDIVVEFESASTASDVDDAGNADSVYAREKRDLYERHWVREYWRIDIDTRTITIDRYDPIKQQFDESPVVIHPGERLTTTELPGFELTTADVFERPVAKLTYNDIVRMPEDLLRHEVIDGIHFARRAGSIRHQLILGNLCFHVWQHVRALDLGLALQGLDIVFSPHDVANADFTYVSYARKKAVLTKEHFIAAPDMVFEILGHDTRERDRTVKRALYEKYGVPEYWLLDPQDESVTIYRRPAPDAGFDGPLTFTGSAQLTTPQLPCFEVALANLFDLRLPLAKDEWPAVTRSRRDRHSGGVLAQASDVPDGSASGIMTSEAPMAKVVPIRKKTAPRQPRTTGKARPLRQDGRPAHHGRLSSTSS